jgi:hypothetical protein
MSIVQIPNNWAPRPHQKRLWDFLEKGGKRAIAICHRRWGKDEIALHFTATAVVQKPATYWHMLPIAVQGRRAIWEAVNPHTGRRRIDEAFPEEFRETTRENEMMIRFKNGSAWYVVGSDAYDNLVGSPPAGVVYSEWALADPASWGYLRPILAENDGWALFITTPRGNNHAKTMFDSAANDPTWYREVSPATATGVFTLEQLEVEKREYMAQFGADQGRALYEQEYLCSFEAAVLGAFYAAELSLAREQHRIGIVPIDRMVPVHTAWDLGYTDSTAIWFIQVVGREVRLVDYHEEGGAGLDHYARVLDEKRREHNWRYADGSNGVSHWFPHDVEHHELTSGTSRAATLRTLGISPTVVPVAHVMDGINATRRLIARAWIDERRCQRGLNALQAYRREWDEVNKVFKPKALHDWSSHGADALRTFAMGFGDDSAPAEKRAYKRQKRPADSTWMSA